MSNVPVEELEELADRWQKMSYGNISGEGPTYKYCSDELEALIEEHNDE